MTLCLARSHSGTCDTADYTGCPQYLLAYLLPAYLTCWRHRDETSDYGGSSSRCPSSYGTVLLGSEALSRPQSWKVRLCPAALRDGSSACPPCPHPCCLGGADSGFIQYLCVGPNLVHLVLVKARKDLETCQVNSAQHPQVHLRDPADAGVLLSVLLNGAAVTTRREPIGSNLLALSVRLQETQGAMHWL